MAVNEGQARQWAVFADGVVLTSDPEDPGALAPGTRVVVNLGPAPAGAVERLEQMSAAVGIGSVRV